MNKQELEEALEAANGKIAELTAALEAANGKIAELTAALEAANGKIAELTAALEAANAEARQAVDLRDKQILELDEEMKRLETELLNAKAAPGAVAEKLSADEYDIRARQRAGLTRAQAEEAHAAQKAHDARLAAAAA